MPTTASVSASVANAPSRTIAKRDWATEDDNTSSIVLTSESGIDGSMARISSRTGSR